jgi:hypothetical protein
MEMAKMMGMMGGMGGKGDSSMAMPSALPGFPGASHLYHIGATGFYLDHPQHIALSTEQQMRLNQIKQQAALNKASASRSVEEAEQDLWMLTAADQPDTAVERNFFEATDPDMSDCEYALQLLLALPFDMRKTLAERKKHDEVSLRHIQRPVGRSLVHPPPLWNQARHAHQLCGGGRPHHLPACHARIH